MPVYFITGTNRGIGLEYVRQLSSDTSNTIFATVRSKSTSDVSALEALKTNTNVHILECDTSSEDSIAKLADAVPKDTQINFLINNAGIQKAGKTLALELPWQSVLTHVTNNALGPAKIVSVLLPHLAPNAVIVNISSGMGSIGLQANGTIPPHIVAYGISKTALNMLTVHQAYELKGKAIVVCVDPGHVQTEMGGPKAPLPVEDSARGVLGVAHKLKEADSGKFFLYKGEELPW